MWKSSQLKSQTMQLRKKKSLKKSRLVGIRSLTSAIPVRGSNQPTGSIKFLYPVVEIFEIHIFIISLPGLL